MCQGIKGAGGAGDFFLPAPRPRHTLSGGFGDALTSEVPVEKNDAVPADASSELRVVSCGRVSPGSPLNVVTSSISSCHDQNQIHSDTEDEEDDV